MYVQHQCTGDLVCVKQACFKILIPRPVSVKAGLKTVYTQVIPSRWKQMKTNDKYKIGTKIHFTAMLGSFIKGRPMKLGRKVVSFRGSYVSFFFFCYLKNNFIAII